MTISLPHNVPAFAFTASALIKMGYEKHHLSRVKFEPKQPLKIININCLNKLFTYLWTSRTFPRNFCPYQKTTSNSFPKVGTGILSFLAGSVLLSKLNLYITSSLLTRVFRFVCIGYLLTSLNAAEFLTVRINILYSGNSFALRIFLSITT